MRKLYLLFVLLWPLLTSAQVTLHPGSDVQGFELLVSRIFPLTEKVTLISGETPMLLAMNHRPDLAASGASLPSGAHQVTLSCTPPVGGGQVTGYKFQRGIVSGGPYSDVGTAATCSFVDSDAALTEGTTYYYVARSTGPGGQSAPSNQASALIPFLPPNPPTGLSATSQ